MKNIRHNGDEITVTVDPFKHGDSVYCKEKDHLILDVFNYSDDIIWESKDKWYQRCSHNHKYLKVENIKTNKLKKSNLLSLENNEIGFLISTQSYLDKGILKFRLEIKDIQNGIFQTIETKDGFENEELAYEYIFNYIKKNKNYG